jgi:hypothetical protein
MGFIPAKATSVIQFRFARTLRAIFTQSNQLAKISFCLRRTLVFAVLIALLNHGHNSLDGATTHRVLPNFELAG